MAWAPTYLDANCDLDVRYVRYFLAAVECQDEFIAFTGPGELLDIALGTD